VERPLARLGAPWRNCTAKYRYLDVDFPLLVMMIFLRVLMDCLYGRRNWRRPRSTANGASIQ
jgi:hypothetical protein